MPIYVFTNHQEKTNMKNTECLTDRSQRMVSLGLLSLVILDASNLCPSGREASIIKVVFRYTQSIEHIENVTIRHMEPSDFFQI